MRPPWEHGLRAGLYVAAQDALETSLTRSLVPLNVRGLSYSYGVFGSVNGVGAPVSSACVGFRWTAVSPVAGFGSAAALMAVGILQMALLRTPAEEAGRPA